jgi:hypothetical protein
MVPLKNCDSMNTIVSTSLGGGKGILDSRSSYYITLNFEEYIEYSECLLNELIRKIRSEYKLTQNIFSDRYDTCELLPCDEIKKIILKNLPFDPEENNYTFDDDHLHYALAQFSPLCRIDGGWLSGVVSLKEAFHASGSAILRIHSRAVGNGNIEDSRAYIFEQNVAQAGIVFPPVYSSEFAFDYRISEYAFKLPAFLLAISEFPSSFYAETLGINLIMSLLDMNEILKKNNQNFLCSTKSSADIVDAYDAIRTFLASVKESGDETDEYISKIKQGFFVTLNLIAEFLSCLKIDLLDSLRFSLHGKVLSIIDKLGTRPFGYHKKGKIGGQPIDYWFDPVRFTPENVLNELVKSRYVIPGKPDKSLFLTYLTKPNGPMFRIFSDKELILISDWIRDLPASRENFFKKELINSKEKSQLNISIPKIGLTIKNKPSKKYNLRELYFKLLHHDSNIDAWPQAKSFATNWLKKHSLNIKKGDLPIPFDIYSHKQLNAWLEHQHNEQVCSYCPLIDYPEETRDEVIDTTIQLAPLIYIDGAWLRRMARAGIVNTFVGNKLYHIFLDELGNGDVDLHHGNIYHSLVHSMGYDLPNFVTQKFSLSDIFKESAFKVPVFWLSISLFPRTFLSEILGLNLAMELSGIGGEYRRSGDVLRHYGFSSQFTDLHNTIDNIVSGHTAWALEAIKIHLDDMLQKGGNSLMQEHWHKVWVGYRSLRPPKSNSKFYVIESISRLFDIYKK